MAIVVDQSEQISFAEIVDNTSFAMYVAQTFVAAGKSLDTIAFYLDGEPGSPLDYRVLVTTVATAADGFHPGQVLFESGKLTEPDAAGIHPVVVNTGGIALQPGQTYAFILDAAKDQDGLSSKARFALSYAAHGGPFGEDYPDGFLADLSANPVESRAQHFAANWLEGTSSSARDLAFILTFTNPGVTIVGTKGNDRVDAEHRVKGQPQPTEDDDTIFGKKGKDRIDALGGNDTIDGGKQKDKLTGGPGEDSFVFSVSLRQKPDKLQDFISIDDTIVLTGKAFNKLDPGALSDAAFRDVGEAATEADRIVYKENGTLALDKDGKGGAEAKVFAKLAGAPDIAALDILVA